MTEPRLWWSSRLVTVLSLCALTLCLWHLGNSLWIVTKARLAQYLIAQAWQQTLLDPAQPHKPWRWADTWPVLQLQWQQHGRWQQSYVLQGASGESLAFGPGLMDGSLQPAQGTTVLAAHRDTHFAYLANAHTGDRLRLQTGDGRWFNYAITGQQVVDSRLEPLTFDPDSGALLLVTCYPFGALSAGGPLRLVVAAERLQPALLAGDR